MNSQMQFFPEVYSQENRLMDSDQRIFGRPFGGYGRPFGYRRPFGFGAPFLGGLLAGTLLSPWGFGGYGYPYGGYGYGYAGYPYGYGYYPYY